MRAHRIFDPRNSPALIVVALSTIALYTRLLIATHGGFWRDEALSLFVTESRSWGAMLDFLRIHESHPPFYYALMRIWISVFGDTDTRSVILPIAFGVALVPVIYLVGKSLFSVRVGLLAAIFAALSPALTEYSAVARPYSLLPLLSLISTWTMIRGLRGGGIRMWVGYVLSTLALLYTHNWGWLVLFGQWVALLLVMVFARTHAAAGIVKQWFVGQVAIAIAYIPWMAALSYQIKHAGHPPSLLIAQYGFAGSIGTSLRELIEATLIGYSPFQSPNARNLIFTLPLIFVAGDQLLRARKPERQAADRGPSVSSDKRIEIGCLLIIPVIAWLAALILSRTSDVMLPRCLAMLAPLLLLALAYRLTLPRRGTMLLNRLAIASFLLTYATSVYYLTETTKSNARELAASVEARTRPSDLVIVMPEWIASSFNRYYDARVEQIDYPHIGREGAIDFSRMFERLGDDLALNRVNERISQAKVADIRVWLVADSEKMLNLSPAAVRQLLTSGSYPLVATARIAQVRARLDSLYGLPDTTVGISVARPRYENVRALLYAPPESATR